MTSNPPGQCCTIGVKHEGEPSGEIKNYAGTESYIAYPKDKSTEKAVLVLTDVIGHGFINAQLIADQFAANGYFVVMPDLFHADPVKLNPPEGFDLFKWLEGHGTGRVDPIVTAAVKQMRADGAKYLGAAGYCFGAKYVVRFIGATGSQAGASIDGGYVAHPSLVEPDELRAITGPLSIAAAETDQIFPEEKRHEAEGILKELAQSERKIAYQINLFSNVVHGFAVRGDITEKRGKFAKETAFFQAVQWFDTFVVPSKQELPENPR